MLDLPGSDKMSRNIMRKGLQANTRHRLRAWFVCTNL